ncbi:MAG TPA: hypothetical protein VMS18_28915 [Candidatus Binatia bacterium]|nr:hypothetical protein [Candidatus Binatia bacterium]
MKFTESYLNLLCPASQRRPYGSAFVPFVVDRLFTRWTVLI